MNPEKMPMPFPGQAKAQEEAKEINEKVDARFARPRAKKNRSKTNVAKEIIKKETEDYISLKNIPSDEKQWYKNMEEAGIKILKDGFLHISKWDKDDKGEIKKTWQKVDGLESAIRMQRKILDKYRLDNIERKSEFSQLANVAEIIQCANDLLTRWKSVDMDEKKALQFQLASVVLQLENCINEFKIVVREKSEKVMGLKDSRGRENPGSLAAETVAALNNLTKRISEMREIMPIIAMRQEFLILEKRRIDDTVRKSKAQISGVLHHPIFREDAKREPASKIKDHEVNILNDKIGKVLYLLGTVHIFPYSSQARQAEFRLGREAKKYFSSKNRLIGNLSPVKEALQEAVKILETNVEYLDKPKK